MTRSLFLFLLKIRPELHSLHLCPSLHTGRRITRRAAGTGKVLSGGLIQAYPECRSLDSGVLSSLELLLAPPSLGHSHSGVLADVPTFHREGLGLKQCSGQNWPLGVTRAGRAARSEASTGLWVNPVSPLDKSGISRCRGLCSLGPALLSQDSF